MLFLAESDSFSPQSLKDFLSIIGWLVGIAVGVLTLVKMLKGEPEPARKPSLDETLISLQAQINQVRDSQHSLAKTVTDSNNELKDMLAEGATLHREFASDLSEQGARVQSLEREADGIKANDTAKVVSLNSHIDNVARDLGSRVDHLGKRIDDALNALLCKGK